MLGSETPEPGDFALLGAALRMRVPQPHPHRRQRLIEAHLLPLAQVWSSRSGCTPLTAGET